MWVDVGLVVFIAHHCRQGTGDNFYKQGQLLPENFLKAARDAGHDERQVQVRSQEGYDHSYYFVRYGLCSASSS